MAFSSEELVASVTAATAPGFRAKLLARGQSRAMVWQEGVLPPDAPRYSSLLSYDLLSYGYSLLAQGLRLLGIPGQDELARKAFEYAAEALEAVVSDGPKIPERDFHRLIAAASYHLGRFSARAYSLLHASVEGANLTVGERCIARLMLRDINALDEDIAAWRKAGTATDDVLISVVNSASAKSVDDSNSGVEQALDLALTDAFMGALAMALLAFERGEPALLTQAFSKLRIGLSGAAEFSLVSQWWTHTLALHLLSGLWDMSFHVRLPAGGAPQSVLDDWPRLRELFIASLYCRKKAEIELWPSQLEAAQRVLELNANLVVSLPTSAGKTRIAELCMLACLAAGKRVVFVTPLRALSAQTEVGLQQTFLPLGKTVSSLYGSIGASGADVDAITARDIIVATPEKLDFAMRSNPALLDDVGLVVLDEGHMIGLNEREVRYEAQIQRLLRREDASQRRIVCLSAILPEGEELSDFVGWLTADSDDGLIQKNWRPTRLRFGEVEWKSDHARLTVSVGDEKPFVPKFLLPVVPPKGRRKEAFPRDQRELCLATAWRLVEEGQSVLIYCPQRRSVEPYANAIVDLHGRGVLASVLTAEESVLAPAIAIGKEWLGEKHVLLECLKIGVAIHHGALPSPYRKEVERLLQQGVLRVTVSSPTLAQGLNLAATSLVFHGLEKGRERVEISEFRNVVGRAGRAYVDVEGLVLLPIFKDHGKHRKAWQTLIDDKSGRRMESGLIRLVLTLLLRMGEKLGTTDLSKLLEYVAGNAAWEFPVVINEAEDAQAAAVTDWQKYVTSLDTALFSLIGDQVVEDVDLENCLDLVLSKSLFHRRLKHLEESMQQLFKATMSARAKHIWAHSTAQQRRGYFLAGVGFQTGQILDARDTELEGLLIDANAALLGNDENGAIAAITAFAEIVFTIYPFAPNSRLSDWKPILAVWLQGKSLSSLTTGTSDEALRFVEDALIYKLPWAMEAVRVRGVANENSFGDMPTLSANELGLAVSAVETGTTSRSAAYLMQAGFGSRMAAIKAVKDGLGVFENSRELVQWLRSEQVVLLSRDAQWPMTETHVIWLNFIASFDAPAGSVWKHTKGVAEITWLDAVRPLEGTPLRIGGGAGDDNAVFLADYQQVGRLVMAVDPNRKGLLIATVNLDPNFIDWSYFGPGKWVTAHEMVSPMSPMSASEQRDK